MFLTTGWFSLRQLWLGWGVDRNGKWPMTGLDMTKEGSYNVVGSGFLSYGALGFQGASEVSGCLYRIV